MEDDGTTKALAKGGMTDLARIAGRTSLARGLGGISLMRIARKVLRLELALVFLEEERVMQQ